MTYLDDDGKPLVPLTARITACRANVGDTDGTHDRCHHPEPEKETVERPRRSGPAVSTSDGWLTSTSFGASGLAVCASSDCTAAS
jgi:hypothetical protein